MLNQAWLFPGQGSQYTQMGRHLWPHRLATDVLSLAESISGLPLKTILAHGPEATLRSPEYLEPAIVALQASYVLLLRSNGIQPDAVAGYSLGEIGALYCAGCLSLPDALTLASARGRILAARSRCGSWLSQAVHFIQGPPSLPLDPTDNVFIAAFNSGRDFTITGEAHDVQAMAGKMSKHNALFSTVAVDGPWHSPLAQESAREIAGLLRAVEFQRPIVPVCLGTSGVFETEIESIRASLSRQIDHPVLWTDSLETLWRSGVRSTVEIGPGRSLTSFVRVDWAQRDYRAQFLERQGGRPVDFTVLTPGLGEERNWIKSA